jgi:CRISPR-associated protein Csx10
MKALTFQVRTIQPVLITRPGAGEENSATAHEFIPGSVLRGLLINRYLQKHSVADAAQDPICRRLFFDGTVVYLNAYPTNRIGERTLPKPLSWLVAKDERDTSGATIYDFAVAPNENVDNLVVLPGAFCWRADDYQVEVVEPRRYVSVHNASENRNVKRKRESSVYRYEAIAPGQLFSAVLLSDNQNDLQTLRTLLEIEPKAYIGGSRSAGYGLVCLENIQVVGDWREYERDTDPEEGIVVLTLLSDAILRDPATGEFTTNLDVVLGWSRLRAYCQTRIAGGFNRKWGLPLIQALALQAGSTFVYKASEVDLQRLEQLAQEGIGERRVDGFGRIAVNWHTQEELQRRSISPESKFCTVQLSETSQRLAKQMAERRLRILLDQKLLDALSRLSISNLPTITNAQLSSLRLVVMRAWRENNPRLLTEHKLKGAYERARVCDQRLMTWLKDGVNNDTLWQDYLQPQDREIPSMAGVKAEITNAIKVEYTMRLLDALLQRTIREKQSGGGAA